MQIKIFYEPLQIETEAEFKAKIKKYKKAMKQLRKIKKGKK